MRLHSPQYSEVILAESFPPHSDGNLNEKTILSGATPKGNYLLEVSKYKPVETYLVDLNSLDTHKLILLKPSPAFFLVVQLQNTVQGELCTLAKSVHYEWSVNLFFTPNFFWEIKLDKAAHYVTFILSIPEDAIYQFSENFPTIAQFTKPRQDRDAEKLLPHNAICNYPVIEHIRSLQRATADKQVSPHEFILECFRLLSKEDVPIHRHVDEEELHKVYALKKYMAEHTTQKYLGKKLSKHFDITAHHLYTVFPQIYGVQPWELDRYYKMSAARAELQQHDIPLKVLAAKYGYASVSGFVKAYQSVHGVHPKEHRKSKVY